MSIRLGLTRVSRLLKALDDPQLRYDTVHVAGTNGKGSVCHAIAAALRLAGYKTGSFTTPHLAYPRDSVRINGDAVLQKDFSKTSRQVASAAARLSSDGANGEEDDVCTPFEQLAASAFLQLAHSGVQVAVVECGMGGRTDATNVVRPVLSVITRIGLDHQGFLGATLPEIATHKAGIIKAGVPAVVSGAQDHPDVLAVFETERVEQPGELIVAHDSSARGFADENRAVARAALRELSTRYDRLTQDVIEEAVQMLPPGRLEQKDLALLGGPTDALLDGAHNRQAWIALRAHLDDAAATGSDTPRTFVLALTRGKDAGDLTTLLRPGDRFCAVEFEPVEGMPWVSATPSADIAATLHNLDFEGEAFGTDVQAALAACADERVTVCGSLYLVGQIYRMLDAARESAALQSCVTDTKVFEPANYEQAIADHWDRLPPIRHCGPAVSMLMPPPNVTGSLHIGHALTLAVQDAYARYYNGKGCDVVWVPGTDHAGIATQSVVARSLAKRGHDVGAMSREDFVEAIWRWCAEYGGKINQQIGIMGAKLDWDREYFTLDQDRSAAVNEAIGRLWRDGLIYRDDRMVNWSVGLQSVISDIETEPKTIEAPEKIGGAQFGTIWRIRYKATDADDWIEVDTTRPETVFGDRAIAVHPEDERYMSWHGRAVQHPLIPDTTLRIVADAFVSRDFGTGAVKLTPAHDVDDYLVAQRLGDIPVLAVFSKDGKMLPSCGVPDLVGVDRLHARAKVVRMLSATGALVSEKAHRMAIKLCSRSGGIIEPMPMPQWYIRMQPLAQRVLADDAIAMSPRTRQIWRRWLEDCQDWCISRQLVWGHRIPLWRKADTDDWFYAVDNADAVKIAGTTDVEQDPDVLDTWFSSGLLPLSAFGWPNDLEQERYQLTFIESGPDILFFWLARMAMLCTYLSPAHAPPFREILLHPIVRDAQGRKMSKSLGNVIDPLDVVRGVSAAEMQAKLAAGSLDARELKRSAAELARQFPNGIRPAGADALRLALIQATAQEHFLNLDIRTVQTARYVCGKLWNAVQFWRHHSGRSADHGQATSTDLTLASEAVEVRWLNKRLQVLGAETTRAFEQRELWRAADAARAFIVDDLCDTYLELLKPALVSGGGEPDLAAARTAHLGEVLRAAVAIVHPLVPFVTEACWRLLDGPGSLSQHVLDHGYAAWPATDVLDEDVVDCALKITSVIRAEGKAKEFDAQVWVDDARVRDALKGMRDGILGMSQAKSLAVLDEPPSAGAADKVVAPGVTVRLERHTAAVDATQAQAQAQAQANGADERKRLRLLGKLEKLKQRRASPSYATRVPPNVQAKDAAQLRELEALLGL